MRIAVPGAAVATLLLLNSARANAQSTPAPPWAAAPTTPSAPPAPVPSSAAPPASPPPAAPTNTPAAPATAENTNGTAAGADLVVLRDGTTVQGAAIDVRPGQTLTLRLASGELRVIPWGEIATGRGPGLQSAPPAAGPGTSSAPPAAVAPPPTGAAAAPSTPARTARPHASDDDDDDDVRAAPSPLFRSGTLRRPRPGTVPVRLESDGDPLSVSVAVPITLGAMPMPYNNYGSGYSLGGGLSGGLGLGTTYGGYGGLGGYSSLGYGGYSGFGGYGGYGMAGTTYQSVCTTPCTLYLRPGTHTFHIGGPGRRESDETITVGAAGQRVRFRSASRSAHALGQTFLWIGVGAAVLGVLLFVNENGHCSVSGCDLTLPLGLMIGGGLAVGIGAPLVLVNATGVAESAATPAGATTASQVRVRVGAAALPGGGLAGLSAVF